MFYQYIILYNSDYTLDKTQHHRSFTNNDMKNIVYFIINTHSHVSVATPIGYIPQYFHNLFEYFIPTPRSICKLGEAHRFSSVVKITQL